MGSYGAPLTVPIVDISPFTAAGDLDSCKQASKELAEKGQINGCVGISGHGVSAEMLKEIFKVAKKLFDLPYEDKMKAPHPEGTTPHRGYSGMGSEKGGAKTALEADGEVQEEEDKSSSDYRVRAICAFNICRAI